VCVCVWERELISMVLVPERKKNMSCWYIWSTILFILHMNFFFFFFFFSHLPILRWRWRQSFIWSPEDWQGARKVRRIKISQGILGRHTPCASKSRESFYLTWSWSPLILTRFCPYFFYDLGFFPTASEAIWILYATLSRNTTNLWWGQRKERDSSLMFVPFSKLTFHWPRYLKY
jgi:hypothetical protein